MAADVKRSRVLVVDDDAGMLRAAERVLAVHHEVACAPLPREALELAPRFRPDLAVCDIRMPEMDGFALAAALRKIVPDLDVIFMTGSHSEPDAHLVRAINEEAFYFIQKPFDRRVLSALVGRCLELRQLRRAQRAHLSRLQHELEEARLFQRTMLGPERARVAGVEVAARCLACQELGGDLYDYAETGDGRLAFIVADVRGHGASAALLTAVVKATFHAAAAHDPARLGDALAAAVGPFGEDRFVTAFCGRLDSARGVLEYVNAGHPAALVIEGSETRELAANAPMACSAFPPGSWPIARTELRRGAGLLVYTDGLPEAIGGTPREATAALVAAARAHGGDPGALIASLARPVEARGLGSAADDVSMLAIRLG
jgi:sigma-B regulation protein RsbU (phosphoserine phosphatase)